MGKDEKLRKQEIVEKGWEAAWFYSRKQKIPFTVTFCGSKPHTHTKKMPATENGEILGRTTFRTRPKSPKNPQQPLNITLGCINRSTVSRWDQ